MAQKYEYKFVRLGEGFLGYRTSEIKEYQNIIHEYAGDGWRLVQIFAPILSSGDSAKFYELIFEKET